MTAPEMSTNMLPLLALISITQQVTAFIPINPKPYTLSHDYSGSNFFNNFLFYTDTDPTNGHVKYVDLSTANSTGLAGFLSSDSSNSTFSPQPPPIFLGVDSSTTLNSNDSGRPSVRLSSLQTFNHALLLLDIQHMPAPVCGTWPALWLLGSAAPWPQAGEIDILENVNDATTNKYTLHTNAGIMTTNHTGYHMKGGLLSADCDVDAPGQPRNMGCSIIDDLGAKSYGDAFNANGGGVFAVLIDSLGVRIWFFERGAVPADIAIGMPNPPSCRDCMSTANASASPWSLPNARFDSLDNEVGAFDAHFKDLRIVVDTGFCGDWAGGAWNSSETCRALAPSCEEFVSGHPEAFVDVWWGINSIKVFEKVERMSRAVGGDETAMVMGKRSLRDWREHSTKGEHGVKRDLR